MAQMNDNIKTYKHEFFHTYRNEDGTLQMTAELSDFGQTVSQRMPPYSQIYPDACDAGIKIRGKRGEVVFYLEETDMSGEDVAGWNFVPTPESLKQFPEAAKVRVLLIND